MFKIVVKLMNLFHNLANNFAMDQFNASNAHWYQKNALVVRLDGLIPDDAELLQKKALLW